MNGVFNHDAAAWARDVVMKMDEAEAEMFVRAVVHEALHWDISANRRTLNRHIAEVNKSIETDLNTLVSKSAAPVRELVSAVSKALGSDPYNRNEKGQFWPTEQRVRTGAKVRPLKSSQARQRGIPDPTNAYGKPVKLTARQRADFQEQYLQLADAMDRFAATGVDNPHMILRDRITGRQRAVPINPKKLDDGWDPSRVDLVAVRGVGRGGTTLPDASFDLVSALGGSPRVGNAAARGASGLQQGLPTFTERWTDASGDTKGTNERTYRRIQAGSQLLGDVAPGPKAQMASQFGQFVGQYGPEAEKVIGPKMRRTAYRYRGTERTPDKELISAHNYELRQAGITRQGQAPEQAAALGQKAAAAYLLKRLPNLQLAEIQRKSGKIPPSEGVIIDKDGKIVTQAVGFADDHYLPFNLKNLKNLKGGHYVRSRSMGGLTTEDIYTGLISGARSVSVVSNSGIFTIYFADDLRGARRHSDKANSMVERYAKTLDAIKEGQIERERLDPAIRAEIREEIENKYEGQSWVSRNEIEEEIAEEIKNYKSNPYLTKGELEQIEQHVARRRAQGTPENKIKRERNELIEAAMEKKTSRFYSLDGEGYAAAAEALKEQYPYFIENVNFMHRRGLLMEGERGDPNQPSDLQRRFKTGDDKGYVKARYNRPDEVLEGYFDKEIAGEGEEYGTGKTKASHTNYQNWEHNPVKAKAKGKLERKESESETEPEKPKTAAASAKVVRQQVARAQVARNQKQLASEATAIAHRWATSNYPALEAAREGFDSVWDDLTRRKDLIAELESAQAALARMDDDEAKADARALQSKITALRVESGRAGGMDYNPKEHMGVHASQPYAFDGDAYQPGASADQVRTEMTRQLAKAKQVFGDVVDLTQMSDRQLAEIGATSGRLSATMRAGTVDVEALSEMATILGTQNPEVWVASRLRALQRERPENLERMATGWGQASQAVERIRRLKLNMPAEVVVAPKERVIESMAEPAKQQWITTDREAAEVLENMANRAKGTKYESDYREMAILMSRGRREEAERIARSIDESDPVNLHTLDQIFPDPFNNPTTGYTPEGRHIRRDPDND